VAVAGESAAFDALADGHRREILAMLRQGDRAVHEIAEELPISRPAVSRHLRLLKEAGFVEEEAVGTRRLYHLKGEGVEAVRRYLETVWGDAATRFRILAENVDGPGQ
jgi:DNA-binding transcriptional ArsR family regulator